MGRLFQNLHRLFFRGFFYDCQLAFCHADIVKHLYFYMVLFYLYFSFAQGIKQKFKLFLRFFLSAFLCVFEGLCDTLVICAASVENGKAEVLCQPDLMQLGYGIKLVKMILPFQIDKVIT